MADRSHGPNQYNSTPRKVFDKHVDRMETKRQRDREDHRADMQALIKRLNNLEDQLNHLSDHVNKHCSILSDEDDASYTGGKDGNEELE